MPDETISVSLGDISISICRYEYRSKDAADARVRRVYIGWMVNGQWVLPPEKFDADFVRSLNTYCQERGHEAPGWQDYLYVSIGWWEDVGKPTDSTEIVQHIFGCISKAVADKNPVNSSSGSCLQRYLDDLALKR